MREARFEESCSQQSKERIVTFRRYLLHFYTGKLRRFEMYQADASRMKFPALPVVRTQTRSNTRVR